MQRILVVDDDPAVTSLLKRALSYEGFTVDTASSGQEGLTIARDRPPDLAILDVISRGRVEATLGIGYRPHEYRMFGIDKARRVQVLDEVMDVLEPL